MEAAEAILVSYLIAVVAMMAIRLRSAVAAFALTTVVALVGLHMAGLIAFDNLILGSTAIVVGVLVVAIVAWGDL